jgi:hypothetical protein
VSELFPAYPARWETDQHCGAVGDPLHQAARNARPTVDQFPAQQI